MIIELAGDQKSISKVIQVLKESCPRYTVLVQTFVPRAHKCPLTQALLLKRQLVEMAVLPKYNEIIVWTNFQLQAAITSQIFPTEWIFEDRYYANPFPSELDKKQAKKYDYTIITSNLPSVDYLNQQISHLPEKCHSECKCQCLGTAAECSSYFPSCCWICKKCKQLSCQVHDCEEDDDFCPGSSNGYHNMVVETDPLSCSLCGYCGPFTSEHDLTSDEDQCEESEEYPNIYELFD